MEDQGKQGSAIHSIESSHLFSVAGGNRTASSVFSSEFFYLASIF